MYEQRPMKAKISISIDSDVERAIKILSERDDRSFSQYINRVLKQHLVDIGYYDEHKDED
ncbi:MAG: toxin-antitoxin system protein [Ruminococcaceae bacterium]|nr:toxin-antitoxin system protein [Oscillospiraceae bacterium]